MDIVIVTTANTDEEAKELLTQLGMPFQNKNKTHRRRVVWLKNPMIAKNKRPKNIQLKNILVCERCGRPFSLS